MSTGKKNNPAAKRQHGMTLLEVMMAFTVLLVGLLTLFKVATVASSSNVRTRQFQNALTKAQDVLEIMKDVPTQTLACLAGGTAASGCYTSCVNAGADPQTCSVALGTDAAWYQDTHGMTFIPTITAAPGAYTSTYEVQVFITWVGDERPPKTHNVILKTMVYRP
ncbi:prepilin-type N-terminal cleavage/methylation domain-containing protein [Myxococcota bacterium]|nr:prepilin-type N-terminal cleavage/methylation domain-containing protein [Myxococcota bacterium]